MTQHAAGGALHADMPAASIICCTSHAEIAAHLHRSITKDDVILFKGSRGMAMEKAAAELKDLIQHTKGE
jgi:UDP-N-acetylmuramyl pentapeptide synthase